MQTPVRAAETAGGSGVLRLLVSQVLRRLRWLALGARLLVWLAAFALALWAVVGVDALWPMEPAPRYALRVVLPLAALGLLVWAVWPRRAKARGELHGAALVEEQLGLASQPLATALTLPETPAGDDPLTRALCERAMQRADAIAQPADPGKAAPLARLGNTLGLFWLALILWLVTTLLFPALPGTGLARLVVPGADVPPFSLTKLSAAWSPAPPTAGDDVYLTASAEGLATDEVVIVFLDDAHRPVERRPMVQTDAGVFHSTLHNLREPVTFHLEAHGRHTRRYTITPDAPEPDPDAPEEDGDDSPGQTQDEGQPAAGGDTGEPTGGGDGQAGGGGELDSEAPALMGELADLISRLADLAEQAGGSAGGDGPVPEALAEQLQELTARGDELADQLDAAAGDSPALAEALARLAEALRGMRSPGMLPGPSDGQPGWSEALAEAARADAAELARGLGESRSEIESGLTHQGGGEETPGFRDPEASGRYDETVGGAAEGVLPDALMQQVPPRYRDQTAAYFRRLAEERDPGPAPEEQP